METKYRITGQYREGEGFATAPRIGSKSDALAELRRNTELRAEKKWLPVAFEQVEKVRTSEDDKGKITIEAVLEVFTV